MAHLVLGISNECKWDGFQFLLLVICAIWWVCTDISPCCYGGYFFVFVFGFDSMGAALASICSMLIHYLTEYDNGACLDVPYKLYDHLVSALASICNWDVSILHHKLYFVIFFYSNVVNCDEILHIYSEKLSFYLFIKLLWCMQ